MDDRWWTSRSAFKVAVLRSDFAGFLKHTCLGRVIEEAREEAIMERLGIQVAAVEDELAQFQKLLVTRKGERQDFLHDARAQLLVANRSTDPDAPPPYNDHVVSATVGVVDGMLPTFKRIDVGIEVAERQIVHMKKKIEDTKTLMIERQAAASARRLGLDPAPDNVSVEMFSEKLHMSHQDDEEGVRFIKAIME